MAVSGETVHGQIVKIAVIHPSIHLSTLDSRSSQLTPALRSFYLGKDRASGYSSFARYGLSKKLRLLNCLNCLNDWHLGLRRASVNVHPSVISTEHSVDNKLDPRHRRRSFLLHQIAMADYLNPSSEHKTNLNPVNIPPSKNGGFSTNSRRFPLPAVWQQSASTCLRAFVPTLQRQCLRCAPLRPKQRLAPAFRRRSKMMSAPRHTRA